MPRMHTQHPLQCKCGGALTLLHDVEVALMLDPAPATDPTARTTIVTRSIAL